MLSDDDKAAVSSLLTRYVRAWNARDADQKLLAAVNARIADHAALFQKLIGAFSLYGFEAVGSKEAWDKIREALGDQIYSAAVQAGNAGRVISQEEKTEIQSANSGLQNVTAEKPTVRDGILTKLKADGKEGSTARNIRDFLESSYAMKLHDKTVGMTLYRLSREGIARREGRTWFFVPPVADTKNPGAGTPGSEDDLL